MAENEGKPKSLLNSFQRILHKSLDALLPDHTNLVDLAYMFGHFFSEKKFKIGSDFQSSSTIPVIRPSPKNILSPFTPVSEDDVLKILSSSKTKTCDLDPIPTSLVKECADVLKTRALKLFMLLPFSKNSSMDKNILKNYRPVSNLSFLSKLFEKVVAKQLNDFINQEDISIAHQSAYRSIHLTETALIKSQNDIYLHLWIQGRQLLRHC